MNKTKGFIFDLDGTLTLSQHLHYLALHEVFLAYDIDYTQKEDQEKFSGKGSRYTCEQVLKNAGKDSSPAEIDKCATAKKEAYDKIISGARIDPVPGIEAFLEKARTAGIKMIIATGNKLEATHLLLQKAGIGDFFGKIVSQSDVKNQKPAPDIFLKAASELGLKPEECVVFEDAINGITAAKAGQIPCVALTTGSPAEDLLKAGADITVADYNDQKLIKLFN
jgi:beta-phosphoglucomutase